MKSDKSTARLRKIVESFSGLTVAVLADLVADEFVFGEISRVSREAPVLILKHRERTVLPGGGANAINNLADLGVKVLPGIPIAPGHKNLIVLPHLGGATREATERTQVYIAERLIEHLRTLT